jgi:hypothetical protein
MRFYLQFLACLVCFFLRKSVNSPCVQIFLICYTLLPVSFYFFHIALFYCFFNKFDCLIRLLVLSREMMVIFRLCKRHITSILDNKTKIIWKQIIYRLKTRWCIVSTSDTLQIWTKHAMLLTECWKKFILFKKTWTCPRLQNFDF